MTPPTATASKKRPILFSAPMVRAILDGTKTQTRRPVKVQPRSNGYIVDGRELRCRNDFLPPDAMLWADGSMVGEDGHACCPFGIVGDRLWVRECAYYDMDDGKIPKVKPADFDPNALYYRADGDCCAQIAECCCAEVGKPRWTPSIHLPRWASRLSLDITDVRVQRLHDISIDDIAAEGVRIPATEGGKALVRLTGDHPPTDFLKGKTLDQISGEDLLRAEWASTWSSAYGRASWDANPWVWAISFKRAES